MSVNLNRTGGLEPPKTTLLDSTSAIEVFASSILYGRSVETIIIANIDTTNAINVTLEWVDATPTAHLFYFKEIPAKDTVIISEIPILAQGTGTVRSIKATASAANKIYITAISSAQTKQSPVAG